VVRFLEKIFIELMRCASVGGRKNNTKYPDVDQF